MIILTYRTLLHLCSPILLFGPSLHSHLFGELTWNLVLLLSYAALKNAILEQEFQYAGEVIAEHLEAKSEIKRMRMEQEHQATEDLKKSLPTSLKCCSYGSCTGKGASSWLTSTPIEEFGFTLHEGAFHDALAI